MIDAQGKGADPYQGGSGGDDGDRKNGETNGGAIGGANGETSGGNGTRRERREQTRAALLDAAERLWGERGIHGASLDDIAAAAGLTKGAVYSNFSGKTDLLLALLERWTVHLTGTEVYAELNDPALPPEERFERAGRAYARCLGGDAARPPALLLLEFWLYGMRDHAAGRRMAGWYAERRARLARGLRETEGLPAQDRAALTVALDFGLTLQHLLDPDRVPADLYTQGLRLLLGRTLT